MDDIDARIAETVFLLAKLKSDRAHAVTAAEAAALELWTADECRAAKERP